MPGRNNRVDPMGRDRVPLAYRRLRWVVTGGAVCWLALAGRLVQLQALQHDRYAAQAEGQYKRRIELPAKRGTVYDRQHRELAVDLQRITFCGDPAVMDEPDQVAAQFADLGTQGYDNLLRQVHSPRRFVYLARQLDGDALERARQRRFTGVFEIPETRRNYPYGRVAAQLIGYTDIDNRGSEGLEMALESILAGKPGWLVSYVDAKGRVVPGHQQEQQQPQDGDGLVLTIDALYQDILEEELEKGRLDSGAETALGVITDPRTGSILAMANAPLYDPNTPGETAAGNRRNRVVTDPFEPGSTFKVITGSSALEEKVVRPEDLIFCENGRLALPDGSTIRDHDPYGTLTFRQVIEKSSNIGTLKVARRMQRGQFYEHLRAFGIGLRTGIDLPSESAGLLHPVGRWSGRSQETIAIGQEVSLTALQLAQAVGAVANGGTLMAPQLYRQVLGSQGEVLRQVQPQPIRRVVSEATAATMRDILSGVVERGTGQKAKIEGIAVAGKTGTAQRAAPDGRGYIPGEIVASFVGFLPADRPELLCLIVLDNPKRDKWGGALAAPIFKRVVDRVLYLSKDLALRPQASQTATEPQADSVQVTVPDLRGLTRQAARFQADLRRLPVRFDGSGDLVVAQEPPAGTAAADTTRIGCVLGEPEALSGGELATAPLRQSLLLRNLSRIRMAALE